MNCLVCGSEITIKDNDRFSSALCDCRIIIYYYLHCQHIEISKNDYLAYKKRMRLEHGEKEKKY